MVVKKTPPAGDGIDWEVVLRLPERQAARAAKAHLRAFHSETIKALKSSKNDIVVAVLGATLLDEQLMDAIRSRFEVSDEISEGVFHHKDGLPLAGKVQLGYALGLYGKRVLSDLKRISEVRNKLAHALVFKVSGSGKDEPLSFAHSLIVDKCKQLTSCNSSIDRRRSPKSARARYIAAVLGIAEELGMHKLGLGPERLRQRTGATTKTLD